MASHKGETVRYSRLLFRLAGCATIGLVAALVTFFGVLDPFEDIICDWLLSGRKYGGQALASTDGMGVVLLVCLAPAALRIEQPLGMVAWGIGIGFVYCLVAAIILLIYDTVIPILPALAGLSGTTGLLGFLAWSDERLRLRRLQSAEKARQQFTDMLVHDLKRRMSSILMSLSVLEANSRAGDRTREIMATMKASAERMLMLTANLLDVRRMQEGRLVLRTEAMPLRDLLRETLREHLPAAELAGVSFQMSGEPDVVAAADRGILGRVLTNLFWNAIQHAPKGSAIEVCHGRGEPGRVFLSVSNGGAAIPAERQAGLFKAFVSGAPWSENSAAASTGLGLVFCRLAAEAHGGTIGVQSPRPGFADGVRVVVTLPSAP
jgi:signal transduction histidine kinase